MFGRARVVCIVIMILKYLLVLLFGAIFSLAVPPETSNDSDLKFRDDYKYEPETETYYKGHAASLTWFEAIDTCQIEGAELAVPFTKIEADLIKKHISYDDFASWLGIHDMFSEGNFITLNGTWVSDISYTDLTLRKPNSYYSYNGIENCLVMVINGTYKGETCTRRHTFVCTKHRSEVTRNLDCETASKGYFLEREAGRCYKIHTTPKTWREAFITCSGEEATLAIVNSQEEADIFIKYLAKHSERDAIFLDFTDIFNRGEFLTSNGKTLEESGYSAWWSGEPDFVYDEEHCGIMRKDGKLDYLRCYERAIFICEKTLKNSTQLIDSRFDERDTVKAPQETLTMESFSDSDLSFRKDYIYENETETYYKIHNIKENWSDAIATCRLEGAELAVKFAEKYAFRFGYESWIGAHDLFSPGRIITLNGIWASEIGIRVSDREQNLFVPINEKRKGNCIIATYGKYENAPCTNTYSFICTKRRSEITLHHECETTFNDYFLESEAGRCYKIHTTPMTWRDAFSTCYNEGTSLAMANSQAEADLFIKYLTRPPVNTLEGNFKMGVIFLDFTDIITRGKFLTSKGKTLGESGYNKWLYEEPDNLYGERRCGIMRKDGQLDYLRCNDRTIFVCEKTLKHSPQNVTDKGH